MHTCTVLQTLMHALLRKMVGGFRLSRLAKQRRTNIVNVGARANIFEKKRRFASHGLRRLWGFHEAPRSGLKMAR
jgi:hypothetical protein